MNENKFMALLLGECWHEWESAEVDNPKSYKQRCIYCGTLGKRWPHGIVPDDDKLKNHSFHDSKGCMTLETMDKIQERMPEVWEKYLRSQADSHNLSNFITYLREHKEEWAWQYCEKDCVKYRCTLSRCTDCKGGNIHNPAYAEALRELNA